MEKFMQRGKVMVEECNSSKSVPHRRSLNDEMDFDDVFGGPPSRRFSMQEVRVKYSFDESDEKRASSFSSSMPVFGEELSTSRRRLQSVDFFEDIFRGDESHISPSRRFCNVFGSNAGSSIMSPVGRPKPRDPFGTSLPAEFSLSLPARVTKTMEFPTVNSTSPRSSILSSRFSNLGIQDNDGITNEVVYSSPFEASFRSHDHSPSTLTSDHHQKENVENLKNVTRNVDGLGNQFHFSIHSWAGGGVPTLMPMIGSNKSKSKDISVSDMFASSNGENDHMETESLRKENEKRDSHSNEESKKLQNAFQEAHYTTPEYSQSRSGSKDHSVGFGGAKQDINDEPGIFKEMNENKTRSSRSSLTGEDINSKMASGNINRVTGNVPDFVQNFNQEADIKTSSQSFQWKDIGVNQEMYEDAAEVKENVDLKNADKKPDVSLKVDEYINNDEAQQHSNQKNAFPSPESIHKDTEILMESSDDNSEYDFMVEEIFDDHEKVIQGSDGSEDIKALDSKLKQWSVGKEGNIRSLLSTLQYVLWTGSGWKPVALVDLIEPNSVKRTYQKALLRLHPDKLQQKDADNHHKYIAEKVFDILQDAWDHFNTLAPL